MSSVVINKKHFAFISAPATKRVERLLKSTELRREAGETCKSYPSGRATEESRRTLDLAVAIKKAGRSAGIRCAMSSGVVGRARFRLRARPVEHQRGPQAASRVPAALVRRGDRRLLHRPRRPRAG